MDSRKKPDIYKRKSGVLALLGLGAFGIILGLLAWNSPILGRRLPQPDLTVIPTQPLQGAPTGSMQAGSGQFTQGEGETACGGPDRLLVLALGVDENAQADVIRLVRVDFITQKVRILTIPRDFNMPIPGFEEHGITEGRISAAYGYGERYLGEGKGNGVIAVANTLYANYGLQFDRYVVVNIRSATKWVDRIGGVDIVLDKSLADPDGTVYFEAGEHHLDGEQALQFFLIRSPDSDIERGSRQSQLFKALYAKAVGSLELGDLTSLALEIATDEGTLTDLSPSDVSSLACLAKSTTGEDIEFLKIPQEMYNSATTELGGSILVPHPEVGPFILQKMKGDLGD